MFKFASAFYKIKQQKVKGWVLLAESILSSKTYNKVKLYLNLFNC